MLLAGLWLAVSGGLHAIPPPLGSPQDLTVRVTVDQPAYPLGSPVQITRSTCNETPDPIRFHGSGSLDPYAEILDGTGAVVAYAQPEGHDASIWTIEYEPGECRVVIDVWYQSSGRFDHLDDPLGPPVAPGTYRARSQSVYNGGSPTLGGVSPPFRIGELPIPAPALSRHALILIGSPAHAAGALLRR